MNKQEFLAKLRKGLLGMPKDDIEERLIFYSEMIDDRMEEGLSEEEAISAVGAVKEIIAQILADIPFGKIAKERIIPKRRLKVWEILLLVICSPIWLSLLIAACAVILSIYISLWTVIISLWAVAASLVCCALGGLAGGLISALSGSVPAGIAMIGAGIACAGLFIFAFLGCKAVTKGTLLLAKKIILGVKNCLAKREDA